jgi:hypothetical protein
LKPKNQLRKGDTIRLISPSEWNHIRNKTAVVLKPIIKNNTLVSALVVHKLDNEYIVLLRTSAEIAVEG